MMSPFMLLKKALAFFETHPNKATVYLLMLATGLFIVGHPFGFALAVTCIAQVGLRWGILGMLKITNPIQKLTNQIEKATTDGLDEFDKNTAELLENIQSFQYSGWGLLTGVGHGHEFLDPQGAIEREHAAWEARFIAREQQKPKKYLEQYLNVKTLNPEVSYIIFGSALLLGVATAFYLMAGSLGLAVAAGCATTVLVGWGVFFGLRITMPLALIAEHLQQVTDEVRNTVKRLKSPIEHFKTSLWVQVAGIAPNPINSLITTPPDVSFVNRENLAKLAKLETWMQFGTQLKESFATADWGWFGRRWLVEPVANAHAFVANATKVDEIYAESEEVIADKRKTALYDRLLEESEKNIKDHRELMVQQKQITEIALLTRLMLGVVGSGLFCALAAGGFIIGTPLAIAVAVTFLSAVVLGWGVFFIARTTKFIEKLSQSMIFLTGEVSEVFSLVNNTMENFKNSFWGRVFGISNHSLITDVTILATRLGVLLKEAYVAEPTKLENLKNKLIAGKTRFSTLGWGVAGSSVLLGLATGFFLMGGPMAIAMSLGFSTTVILGWNVLIGLRLTAPFQNLHDLIQCLSDGAGDVIQTGHQGFKNAQNNIVGRTLGLSNRSWFQVKLVDITPPMQEVSLTLNTKVILGVLASAGIVSVASYCFLTMAGVLGITLGVAGVTSIVLSWILFFGLRMTAPLRAISGLPERLLTELSDILKTVDGMVHNLRNSRLGVLLGVADSYWSQHFFDSDFASRILGQYGGFLADGLIWTRLLGYWNELPNVFPVLRSGLKQLLSLAENGRPQVAQTLETYQVRETLGLMEPSIWAKIKNTVAVTARSLLQNVLFQRGLAISTISLLSGLSVVFLASSTGAMIVSATCAVLAVAGITVGLIHYVIPPFFNVRYQALHLTETAGARILGLVYGILQNLKQGNIGALFGIDECREVVTLDRPQRPMGMVWKITAGILVSSVLTGVSVGLCLTSGGLLFILGASCGMMATIGWMLTLSLTPIETVWIAVETVWIAVVHDSQGRLKIMQASLRGIRYFINKVLQIEDAPTVVPPTTVPTLHFVWLKVIKLSMIAVLSFAVLASTLVLAKAGMIAFCGLLFSSTFLAGMLGWVVGIAAVGLMGKMLFNPVASKVTKLLQELQNVPVECIQSIQQPVERNAETLRENFGDLKKYIDGELFEDAVNNADWAQDVPRLIPERVSFNTVSIPEIASIKTPGSDDECEDEFFDAPEDLNEEVRSTSSLSSDDERISSPV